MAAYAIQFRRGTTTQHNSFTGLLGEVTVDTDKKTLVVHDGSTTGGFPLAREGANLASAEGSFTSNVSVGGTFSVTSTASFSDDVTITGDLGMTGHIIPSANITYDLGSSTMMWRDIYVGPGSLYVNGKKVIEDNAGTINITTDANQNLKVETTGTGALQLSSAAGISVNGELNALTGDLQFGDHIDMNSNRIKEVSAPVDGTDAANKNYVDTTAAAALTGGSLALSATTGSFSGNVAITGNLTVQGTTTTVNSETISLADNIIDLNSNMTSGTPTENAGLRILRGDEAAVQIRWNETSDEWEFTNDGVNYKSLDDLGNNSTDELAEGSTNLYYTDARVIAALAAGSVTSIDTGNFSVSSSGATFDVDMSFSNGSTNVFVIDASTGNTTIGGTTVISGGTTINNTFDVSNDVTFSGDNLFTIENSSSTSVFAVDVTNNTTEMNTALTVNNDVVIAGDNNFTINSSTSATVFDIDVANNTTLIGGATTVNNDFAITNSSSTNVFDVDVTASTFNVALDATFNNTVNVANDFSITNSSSSTVVDIDVTANTYAIDMDLTVNNSATFNNNLTINNSSSTAMFDIDVTNATAVFNTDLTVNNDVTINNSSNTTLVAIDVTNATYDIDMALTVNNATTINNNFLVNNTSNQNLFDIDVANTTLDIDLDVTINNQTTINNTLVLGGGLTLSASAESTIVSAVKSALSMTHSGIYVVTAADNTGNTGSSHAITAATLGFDLSGKEFYQVYLNRQLLRPTEYTVNGSNGTITFTSDVLAEDDEIEAVMYG